MVAKAKPRETISERTGYYKGKCGGKSYKRTYYFVKRAYIDTEYKAKAALGIPKLLMPYSVVESLYTESPGSGSSASLAQCFGGVYAKTARATAQAKTNATNVLFQKLARQDTFNLGVALAEMKETVGLVASTAIRINSAFGALREGNIKKAFRTLGILDNYKIPNTVKNYRLLKKTGKQHRRNLKRAYYKASDPFKFAAESWLELTYGWTPLLLDVYGGAEHVAKLLHQTNTDLTVSAFSQAELTNSDFGAGSISNVSVSGSGEVKVGYLYHLMVKHPTLRNLASLGLTNPALIAWEKVPFSFVVDWFLPIGDYLKSTSALHGYSVVQGALSVKTSYSVSGVSTNPSFVCSGELTHNSFSRSLSGFPLPVFPSFNIASAINANRATSALSLLKVVFGR